MGRYASGPKGFRSAPPRPRPCCPPCVCGCCPSCRASVARGAALEKRMAVSRSADARTSARGRRRTLFIAGILRRRLSCYCLESFKAVLPLRVLSHYIAFRLRGQTSTFSKERESLGRRDSYRGPPQRRRAPGAVRLGQEHLRHGGRAVPLATEG